MALVVSWSTAHGTNVTVILYHLCYDSLDQKLCLGRGGAMCVSHAWPVTKYVALPVGVQGVEMQLSLNYASTAGTFCVQAHLCRYLQE